THQTHPTNERRSTIYLPRFSDEDG
ncbi:hypothetical protein O988_09567, partial [Pseudogymnoascus sp. VKM F-3808]